MEHESCQDPRCLTLCAPHLCLGCLVLPDLQLQFNFSSFPLLLQGGMGQSVRQSQNFLFVFIGEEEFLIFVFLILKVEYPINPLWKCFPQRLNDV